jgi:hypothetical protein
MATGNAASAETVAVVFICDRQGAALERRERCLKLAGISYRVQAERRPSGTYYKLYVPEEEALAAHLALQMGGCGRATRLKDSGSTVTGTLRDIGTTLWDELLLLLGRLADMVRSTAPRLLGEPTNSSSPSPSSV